MTIKIGINGFGRIGKLVFRAAWAAGGFEVVGINDLMDAKSVAHFLHYDSTQGRFAGKVQAAEGAIVVDGKKIPVTAIKDPAQLPWKQQRAEIVVESTGVFASAEDCRKHLAAGAKKVLLTVPPKDKSGEIKIVVMGVNDNALTASDTLVSNASCTTNCLAPVIKVLQDRFGIVDGLMTTIHSFTNDQRILDLPHRDLRRARAASMSMIPTSTGAAKAIGLVIPELAGKLDGIAVRVPTPDASLVDLCLNLERETSKEELNSAMKEAAETYLKGYLMYTEEPLVSIDIVGNSYSSVFDSLCTSVKGKFVKVFSWYDNEWGYSCRVVDLLHYMMNL